MVYLMVAPFLVVLADYRTALENLTLEKVMLAVVQGQLVRVRPILDLNGIFITIRFDLCFDSKNINHKSFESGLEKIYRRSYIVYVVYVI